MNRLEKLRRKFSEGELDAILISQPENRHYLSGFTGSTGWLLISASNAFLAVDFRYVERAKREAPNLEIIQVKGELGDWFPGVVSNLGFKRVGVEANHLTFASDRQLTEELKRKQLQLQIIPTTGLVESLRALKEPEELELITKAVELADAAFEYAKSIIRPGIMEKEMAWELERFLRERGSETLPFDLIVASGSNSALPHAKPSEHLILPGEPVLIDIGAKVDGYCSDLSRTLYLGKPDETFSRVYDVVLGAQLTALAIIGNGISGDQADRIARVVIEQAGYGEAFGHGLGHGVGLAAHESPRLGPNSSDLLSDTMVFTVEPGVYVAGWGGVRIEDMVVIEKGKTQVLTKAKKILETCYT